MKSEQLPCDECVDGQKWSPYYAKYVKCDCRMDIPVGMRSFSLEDLRKAFDAGRTVENYKGEWQETYSDNCTSAKYDKFEDWLKNLD